MSGRFTVFWAGGLSLVVSAVMVLSHQPYVPINDSADYAYLAQRVVDGHGYTREPDENPTASRAPLYPLFLSGIFGISGHGYDPRAGTDYRAAQLATAVLGGVAVMLLFLVAFELWGRGPALAASLVAAVFPPWLAAATGFFTESMFLVLELAVLLGALAFRRAPGGLWLPALIGVLCGLAAMTRSNGLLILLVVVPALWVTTGSRRRGAAVAAVTVVATCLTLAPWTVRNAGAFDQFVPTTTQGGFSLVSVFNDKSRGLDGDYQTVGPADVGAPDPGGAKVNEAEYDDVLTRISKQYATDHPAYVVKVGVLNTLRTLELWKGQSTGFASYGLNGLPDSTVWKLLVPGSYLVYVLALGGLVVLVRDRVLGRPPFVFWAVPVLLLVTSAFAAGALRYRLPFDPLVLALAGLALATAAKAIRPAARAAT